MKVFLVFLSGFLLCVFPLRKAQPQPRLEFEVLAGDRQHMNTPMCIEINRFADSVLADLVLYETTGSMHEDIPCQVERGPDNLLWFILEGRTLPGAKRTFTLTSEGKGNNYSGFEIEADNKALRIRSGERLILQYNHGEVQPPSGVDTLFKRSAFIHPLWSPEQQVLTRIQPPDHYHHYGIWNPWTRTKFQGRQVDFWNLGEGQGTVRFKAYVSKTYGPVYAEIQSLQEHVDFTAPQGEVVALHELLDLRVWNSGSVTNSWLVDFTSNLNCATDSSILFFKYRYGGGIGFRATAKWGTDNSEVLTSEGKTRDEADATRGRWCIIQGETDGESGESGILFMSAPQNRDHPEPMRVWPPGELNGKGNMFFMFTPIRSKQWRIDAGKNYTLKYRLLVFDGDLSAEEAEMYWNDFAEPPEIRILND